MRRRQKKLGLILASGGGESIDVGTGSCAVWGRRLPLIVLVLLAVLRVEADGNEEGDDGDDDGVVDGQTMRTSRLVMAGKKKKRRNSFIRSEVFTSQEEPAVANRMGEIALQKNRAVHFFFLPFCFPSVKLRFLLLLHFFYICFC